MAEAASSLRLQQPGAAGVPGRSSLSRIGLTRSRLISTAAVLVFFALWQAVAMSGRVSPLFISSPSAVFEALVRLIQNGALFTHLSASGSGYALGLGLAIVVGIPLGIALGWYRMLNAALDPFVSALLATPRVAFFPLIVIWLGIGREAIIFIVFLMTVLDLLVSTTAGVSQIDPDLWKLARSFGARDHQIVMTIALPSAVPYILAGFRLAVGHGLIAIVVGELWIGQVGIGYLLANAGQRFRTAELFGGVLVLAVVGIGMIELTKLLERRFQSWRPASSR